MATSDASSPRKNETRIEAPKDEANIMTTGKEPIVITAQKPAVDDFAA